MPPLRAPLRQSSADPPSPPPLLPCPLPRGCVHAVFGSLVSGVLAQHVFGYEASPADFADMPVTLRENNAKALSHSMVWMMIVPWVVCVGLWSLICFTYPQDRDRAMQTEAEEKTRTQTVAGAVGKADAAAIKDRA